MKRNILFLLSICVLLFSCSDKDDPIKEVEKPPVETKDPFITLKKTNIDFTNEGGSESISIESNVSWTAKSSAGWCTVTPSSGNKSTTTITLTAPSNEDYDNRSCTVTLEGEGLTKTITVNQGEGLGLLITQDRYELGNEESTITVEVKANVEFEVEINDEWITKIEKRGLTTTELEFNIAENDTYGNREGSITIKQKGGGMTSTITIFQSQEDAIILSEKEFDLSSKAQSVEVEVKTNIDYEIIIPEDAKDWVSHSTTRALRTETVVLDIAQNKDYDERTAKIVVKDKKTNLQETVTIKQAANTGLIVSDDKYELSNDGGTIEVEVKANVEFDIDIADNWISQVKTRGLKETKLQFQVAKNQDYDNREGSITIKQKGGNLSSTIKVYQSQKDAIIISDKTVDVSGDNQAVEVELKTNVEFEVIIPDAAKRWVSYTPTRGLRTENLTLNISENKDYTGRNTEVYVKDKKTNLQDTLTINQAANTGLIVSEDKYELSNDGGTIEVEVKANFDYKVTISDNWITQVETRGLTTTNLTFAVAKNESYSNREATITISQIDGDLSSTITVYQSQKNAIILSEKNYNLSRENHTLKIELKTNVDFEVNIPVESKSWVSYTPTRGLREETLILNISENKDYGTRITEVYIKDKETKLQETITISQEGVVVDEIWVEKMGTLGKILSAEQKNSIEAMIVKGEINKGDFDVMKFEMPKLKYIDLKEVKCEGDKIPDDAFGSYPYWNKNISTIILPESITAIGDHAFNGCTGLTGDLILPDGLTEIGKGAFSGCSGFSGELIIPDGVTTIEEWAFNKCSGFTGNLILSDGLIEIGHYAFSYCSGFTGNLILPEGLTTIGAEAFINCRGFTGNLILPEGLTTIKRWAFSGCSGFTGSLNLPAGLTVIEESAFSGCSGFTGTLKLPKELKELSGFNGCTGLSGELIIPDGVHTIGPYAFRDCFRLTGELILPKGLTTIGQLAFYGCIGFTGDLNLPESLKSIGERAFYGCIGFTGDLNLPKPLKSIGERAFYGCKGLTGSLNLPDEMEVIGRNAFDGSSNFSGPLILPDNLKTIGYEAFYGCSGFSKLVIGNSVVTIGVSAFEFCNGLTEVILGKSLTNIYDRAFFGCDRISEKILFPKSLASIRKQSFIGCNKVEAFQFPHTTPFGYYPNMLPSNATVEVPKEAVETYKSTDGWKDYNIVGY